MSRIAQGCVGLLLTLVLVPQVGRTQTLPQRDLCKLFSSDEITNQLGTAVDDGEIAAMGAGCQWFGRDDESYAIIQLADSSYWYDPRGASGYETIDGVATSALSHPEEDGWRAMALKDDVMAVVVLSGRPATRAGAVKLLRQLLERL